MRFQPIEAPTISRFIEKNTRLLINPLFALDTCEKGLITSIFTGLFSDRFWLTIHDRLKEELQFIPPQRGPSVANRYLSGSCNIQVKNAVVWKERIDDIL